jgi:hypothetical protein
MPPTGRSRCFFPGREACKSCMTLVRGDGDWDGGLATGTPGVQGLRPAHWLLDPAHSLRLPEARACWTGML